MKNGAQEDVEGDIKHASPEKQRDCICGSGFWDFVEGLVSYTHTTTCAIFETVD